MKQIKYIECHKVEMDFRIFTLIIFLMGMGLGFLVSSNQSREMVDIYQEKMETSSRLYLQNCSIGRQVAKAFNHLGLYQRGKK